MYCRKCGLQVADEDKYCRKCGCLLLINEIHETSSSNPDNLLKKENTDDAVTKNTIENNISTVYIDNDCSSPADKKVIVAQHSSNRNSIDKRKRTFKLSDPVIPTPSGCVIPLGILTSILFVFLLIVKIHAFYTGFADSHISIFSSILALIVLLGIHNYQEGYKKRYDWGTIFGLIYICTILIAAPFSIFISLCTTDNRTIAYILGAYMGGSFLPVLLLSISYCCLRPRQ